MFEIEEDENLKCYQIFEKYNLSSIFPVSTMISDHDHLTCKDSNVLEHSRWSFDEYRRTCTLSAEFDMFSQIIPEMDKKYRYPDTDSERNTIDLEAFWRDHTNCHPIIAKYDDSVTKYFGDVSSDTLRMPNDIREQYIKIIDEILESLPQFPAAINDFLKKYHKIDVNNFTLTVARQGYGWENGKEIQDILYNTFVLETPNFHSYITSDAFETLIQNYDNYLESLKSFNIDKKGTFIGAEGERQVYNELKFFTNNMKILQNIRLEVNGESIESDLIVICNQGIFIIEVKNLGSTGKYNITVERDGRWTKEYENGKSETMSSITQQNI